MKLYFNTIHEETPGPKWQALFESTWPLYKKWFLSEGVTARPGYVTSRRKLREFMPELLPIYEQVVELAGGSDLLYTRWQRPVIAMIDCTWGVLDGLNEAGLSVSLAFGGRKIVGEGFGIPLILRYILEFCETAAEAAEVLQRVPVHMPYNVTALDRAGRVVTAYLGPDHPAHLSEALVSTNHQNGIDWADYARLTSTVERREFLEQKLADPAETEEKFIRRFRRPPLHNSQYERACGTLYTAIYRPTDLTAEYRLPNQTTLQQSFNAFEEREIFIHLDLARASPKRKKML